VFIDFGIRQLLCDVDLDQLVELQIVEELMKCPDPDFFDMNRWVARGHKINQMIVLNFTERMDPLMIQKTIQLTQSGFECLDRFQREVIVLAIIDEFGYDVLKHWETSF